MKIKNPLKYLFVAIIIILTGFFMYIYVHQNKTISTQAHTWTTFHNSMLGLTLQYPSDMLTPESGAASATTSIHFDSQNMTTPNPYEIRIATEDTNAKDIDTYLTTIQTPFPPQKLIINGLEAREFDEMAYVDYQVYILHNGKVFIITINLPANEALQVKNSITFTP